MQQQVSFQIIVLLTPENINMSAHPSVVTDNRLLIVFCNIDFSELSLFPFGNVLSPALSERLLARHKAQLRT